MSTPEQGVSMSAPSTPSTHPDRRPRIPERLTHAVGRTVSHAVLAAWAVIVIFPISWIVWSSFKTERAISLDPWALPSDLQWDNFSRAWGEGNIGRYFLNTAIVIAPSLVIILMLSAMVSYTIARLRFRGHQTMFYFFMSGMLFPVFLALVPLFFLLNDLNMLNTAQGLILVYAAFSLPFTIFFLTGFFRTIPDELGQAARVDGATESQVFFRIMLPLAKPGLISMAIFNFIGMWNQYILPLVLVTDNDKYVISQGLAALARQQRYATDISGLFAGVVLLMIPTLIVYFFFQNQIQRGLTAGAIK